VALTVGASASHFLVLLGLVYVAALVGTLPRWPRPTWLLPLVWAYLTWTRVRHAPLFAVTAALAVAEMLPYTRWRERFCRAACDLPRLAGVRGVDWRPAALPVALVLAAVVLPAARVPLPVLGYGWGRLDPDHWPVELVPELRRYQYTQPGGTRIFNEYALGGFLICNAPGFRAFIDDRCEVYGDRWLVDYSRAEWLDAETYAREWERAYRFHFALTWRGSRFDQFYQDARGWTLVGRTKAVALYRRERHEPLP
jgi:hypothetical protein